MSIGGLRDRITIQNVTESKDSYGGVTQSWADLATVWGQNVPKASLESDEEPQRVNVNRFVFRIRYRSDITAKMRVLWNSRTFEIKGFMNPDGLRKYMHLICEERV